LIIPGNGQLSATFINMQKDLKPDYAIEIGANAAEFSVEMKNRFDIESVAFEANPDIFNKYVDKIRESGVTYLNYAISDSNEPIAFNIHHNSFAGDNSIKKRVHASIVKSYTVMAYTLDKYFEKASFEKACLWIDVEGANKEVLSGGIETLKRCKSIFIETEDISFWEDQWLTKDVQTFLENQGFEKVAQENVYSMQKNIIFIRKG
jgi:FkbM family methyltransferase